MNVNELKEMSPPEGKGLVYIIRSKSAGGLIKFKTSINDTYIGSTKAKNFLYSILDPGFYTITSKAENTNNIDIQVEAGQTYFILQKVRIGALKARVAMYLTDESEGRQRLATCKLSKILPK